LIKVACRHIAGAASEEKSGRGGETHLFAQFIDVEGLRDHGLNLATRANPAITNIGGDHNHRQSSGGHVARESVEHLNPIHARHVEIQGEHGGMQLPGGLQPLVAVPAAPHLETHRFQEFAHHLPDRVVILNDHRQ